MTALTRPIRRLLGRPDRQSNDAARIDVEPAPSAVRPTTSIAVDIAESDPLLAYLQSAPGPVEVAKLELDSVATRAMRDAGVALIVPLVTQG